MSRRGDACHKRSPRRRPEPFPSIGVASFKVRPSYGAAELGRDTVRQQCQPARAAGAGNQHVFARGCTRVLAEVSPLPTNALCVAERGTALPNTIGIAGRSRRTLNCFRDSGDLSGYTASVRRTARG
jgi:hypothetical protein